MQELERVQAGIDRLGALDVGHGGEDARLASGIEVARGAGDRHVARALEREQAADRAGDEPGRQLLADRRGRLPVRRLVARRGREGGEDPAAEAARAGPREVDVPALPPRREAVRVLAGERVVVAVEHRQHRAHGGSAGGVRDEPVRSFT